MLIESLKVNNGCQKVSLSPNHLPKSCSEELQSFSLFLTGAWATLSHSLSEEEVALSNWQIFNLMPEPAWPDSFELGSNVDLYATMFVFEKSQFCEHSVELRWGCWVGFFFVSVLILPHVRCVCGFKVFLFCWYFAGALQMEGGDSEHWLRGWIGASGDKFSN